MKNKNNIILTGLVFFFTITLFITGYFRIKSALISIIGDYYTYHYGMVGLSYLIVAFSISIFYILYNILKK